MCQVPNCHVEKESFFFPTETTLQCIKLTLIPVRCFMALVTMDIQLYPCGKISKIISQPSFQVGKGYFMYLFYVSLVINEYNLTPSRIIK